MKKLTALFLVLMLFLTGCGSDSSIKPATVEEPYVLDDDTIVYPFGNEITTDQWNIKMTSYKYNTRINGKTVGKKQHYYTSDEGYEFLIVSLAITNNGTEEAKLGRNDTYAALYMSEDTENSGRGRLTDTWLDDEFEITVEPGKTKTINIRFDASLEEKEGTDKFWLVFERDLSGDDNDSFTIIEFR